MIVTSNHLPHNRTKYRQFIWKSYTYISLIHSPPQQNSSIIIIIITQIEIKPPQKNHSLLEKEAPNYEQSEGQSHIFVLPTVVFAMFIAKCF